MISASQFIVEALKAPVLKTGAHSGECVLCGHQTEQGMPIKKAFPASNNTTFTSWNFAALRDIKGIICPYCNMMQLNDPCKIVTMYKKRLRRTLITESGEMFMCGSSKRLGGILRHLKNINEPFLFMDSRKIPSKPLHHIWKSRISLSNQAFYYCNDLGNHLVRFDHIDSDEQTAIESHFKFVMNNYDPVLVHPSDPSLDKKEK